MANHLYDKGCSDEYERLVVDLNGNIECGTIYDITKVGSGVPQITFSNADNVSLAREIHCTKSCTL